MAIHKKSYKGVYNDTHQEFICDTRADVDNLPTQFTEPNSCPTGSTAFVIGNGTDESCSIWMLNSNGQWIEI